MGWFKFLPSETATELTQAPVRRAIKKFTPKDDIQPTSWMSVPLGDIDLVTSLDSSLNEVADYDTFTVVYQDELAEESASYTVVDSVIFNGRLYFQAAENHVANKEINKKYYVYYKYNNIKNLLFGEEYYYIIGDDFVDTNLVLTPKELYTYETGYYSFSFINDNLNWNKGFTELIGSNVKVVFSGPEMQLYGNKGPDYGAIAVKYSAIKKEDFEILPISEQTKTIDLYSAEEESDVLLYSVVNLDYRDYVLDVTAVKSNNPKSSGSKVVLSRADFYYFVNSEILSEEVYPGISFSNVSISGTNTITLQDLKPGKEYVLTVKARNSDLNVSSEYSDTIRFTVPIDETIPEVPSNLELVASFLNVMFVFDAVSDKDIQSYEYELYKQEQMTGTSPDWEIITGESPFRTGFSPSNVFVVSVDENTSLDNSSTPSATESPVYYFGRVRSVDTTGNVSGWADIVVSGDTPLIDDEYVASLTASKITAGTIGAHEITLNGTNSIIKSSDYDGTYTLDGLGNRVWSQGTSGWVITGDGYSEFDVTNVRGTISASSIVINANNYWNNDGTFKVGDSSQYVQWDGANLTITGSVTADSISINANNYWTSAGYFRAGASGSYIDWDGTRFRVGPFSITESGMTGQPYNGDSYIEIKNYGDLTVYSNPSVPPHAYQNYQTNLYGEYIRIAKTDPTANPPKELLLGNTNGNDELFLYMALNGSQKVYLSTNNNGQLLLGGGIQCSSSSFSNYVNGPFAANNGLTVNGPLTANSSLAVGSNATFNGTITANSSLAVGSNATFNGTIVANLNGSNAFTTRVSTGAGAGIARIGSGNANYTSLTVNTEHGGLGGNFYLISFYTYSSNVGTIYHNGSNTTYATGSDYRIKTDFSSVTNGLDIINALKPTRYKFLNNEYDTRYRLGFLAHEVQEVLPTAVLGEKDGIDDEGNMVIQNLDYSSIISPLVAAVQDLYQEVQTLKSMI